MITKFKQLNINGLVVETPIVQGGMGVGISLSGLASAVAAEGGIGVISAAQPGFNTEGFFSNPLKANLKALAHHIKRAKEKAKGGVVGVNIMCALTNYAEYVKCAIENKADLIISGAGLPLNLPELIKDSAIKIAPIVSSVKAAAVILRMWDRKYGITADAVVVEGPRAGGHLGFSPEDIELKSSGTNFDSEIKEVIAHISEYEDKYSRAIPTIFGGGVYDKNDIQHYINLGCSGVQMATKFVATEECDAHENFKLAYVRAKKEDIAIVKSPVGMPGRAIMNEFIRKIENSGKAIIEKCHTCIVGCNPKNIPYCITVALTNSANGNMSQGLIFCGDTVDRVKNITTVKKIFQELR